MNIQEREQLTAFLAQLRAARAEPMDAEADSLIRETVGRQPDAAYLLVQKVFWLERAVQEAGRRAEQLQGELERLRAVSPLPGSLADANGWGHSAGRSPWPPVPAQPLSTGGGASSWLGNVATTAAGVVAGAFLFQGIGHLLGHSDAAGASGGKSLAEASGEQTAGSNLLSDAGTNGDASGFEGLTDGLGGDDDTSWL